MKTKWHRDCSGTAAVEFALLTLPYLLLIFGIMEIAFVYGAASMLEAATLGAARQVVTGQYDHSAGARTNAKRFREAVCERTAVLVFDCEENLMVDSRVASSFGDFADDPPAMDESAFDVGGSQDTMVLRARYTYHMMTPLVGELMGGADRQMVFTATVAAQNEPFN